MPKSTALASKVIDAESWTPTVLLRGELLRGLKERGQAQAVRGRLVARVKAHEGKFSWDVVDGPSGSQIAFGVAFLPITVCTSAAIAMVTAEQEVAGELKSARRRS